MQSVIKNGLIVDPANRTAVVGDLLLEDDRIADLAHPSLERDAGLHTDVIDAHSYIVVPGFVDLAADVGAWGTPSFDATMADAVQGGWTTLTVRPDAVPALGTPLHMTAIQEKARADQPRCLPLTSLLSPEGLLLDLEPFVAAGAVAATDRDHPIADPVLLRAALQQAAALDLPVLLSPHHPHWGGVMHAGAWSAELGLRGTPAAGEETAVAQILALASTTRARVHLLHLTTAGSIQQVRMAKSAGLAITASVTPQHLVLTDRWVGGWLSDEGIDRLLDPTRLPPYDRRTRFSPPLRAESDRLALLQGVSDGTIDAIASDHHTWGTGPSAFGSTEPGVPMWDTALALALVLVQRGELDVLELVARLSYGPAQILGLKLGTLATDAVADITIIDSEAHWIMPEQSPSPLAGQNLKGRVVMTLRNGEVIYRAPDFANEDHRHPLRAARIDGLLS